MAAPRRRSAGIVVHRGEGAALEVLLAHPGGPLWTRRDLGAWSIPKGEHEPEEDSLAAARREFEEELGTAPPAGPVQDLGEVRQKGGKVVHGWGVRGDLDVGSITSNTIEIEWPPRSGKRLVIPEVDRAEWFTVDVAREKINPAQAELLDRLGEILGSAP
jgi:predicted NUDIX family NTP pyrophosphohydrolase